MYSRDWHDTANQLCFNFFKSTSNKCWRGKREPSYIAGGNANWYNHQREQYEDSLKTKNKTTICFSNPTPQHLSGENFNSERYMHYNVHYSTNYNSLQPRHGSKLNARQISHNITSMLVNPTCKKWRECILYTKLKYTDFEIKFMATKGETWDCEGLGLTYTHYCM